MIGSINSMSYLEPHKWWKWPLVWFRRTQKVSVQEQYERYNVRAFDLHVYFNKSHDRTIFKYGNIEYETFSVYETLNYFNNQGDCYARIVLEETSLKGKRDEINDRERKFYDYCSKIELIYPDIKFFGGYRECDYRKIYRFRNDFPDNVMFYERVDKLKL
jgi:hypothetical protein